MSKEILQKILNKAESGVYKNYIYPIRKNERVDKIRRILQHEYSEELSIIGDNIDDAQSRAQEVFENTNEEILYMIVETNPLNILFYTEEDLIDNFEDK